MSFRIHLVIVSCIIAVVYLAWQWLAEPEPTPAPANNSPYSITIIHAHWGLNCRYTGMSPAEPDGFASDPNAPLREDNVFAQISGRCNGKLQCLIPMIPAALGKDPAPGCTKELVIQYRCFSYDRPWTVKSMARVLEVNCDKPVKPE